MKTKCTRYVVRGSVRGTISTNATLIDRDELIRGHGLTVISYPETADECAQVMIGSTMHRTDDLIITADRIASKLAGWEVAL